MPVWSAGTVICGSDPMNTNARALATANTDGLDDLSLPFGDGGAPDLQRMVRCCGGYPRIPVEAWAEHDRLLAACHARLARLHKVVRRKKSALSDDNTPDFFTP
jgi:hypothetical protein